MSEHTIKFERNIILNVYRATCSCGWSTCEPKLQTVQERATIHELNKSEWETITPKSEKGFGIRKTNTNTWLNSATDSGRMSVFYGSLFNADVFPDRATANSMLARVRERYPNESIEIVPYTEEHYYD